MNAVIFNGSPANGQGTVSHRVREAAARELGSLGWTVKVFDLEAMNIKPCRGCFACWLKHPGTCAIQDDEEEILKAMASQDVALWISPVTFGGYASTLKKALDRAIPILLPFFIVMHGEIHHPQRYPRARRLLAVGTLEASNAEAERIFTTLVKRNALNLQAVRTESAFIYERTGDAEIAARIKNLIRAAEIA